MSHDFQMAIQHFERILLLAKYLSSRGISIYEEKFDPLFFGSWYVIVGTRHHRFKFFWDGRDEWLTIEESEFPDSGSRGQWRRIADQAVDARHGEDPFKHIEEHFMRNGMVEPDGRGNGGTPHGFLS